jgi:hypothetical protein
MMNSPHDRRVPCPYCGSARGEHCRDGQGDYVDWNHAVRINEARELDPVKLRARLDAVEALLTKTRLELCLDPPQAPPGDSGKGE